MQNTIEHADSHSVLSCKLDAAFIGQLFSQQLFWKLQRDMNFAPILKI